MENQPQSVATRM